MRALPLLAVLALMPFLPAEATLGDCLPPACVPSTGFGYAPPLLTVATGASVQWEALDQPHVSGEVGTATPCFEVGFGTTGPSAPVTFDLAGGLHATVRGLRLACATATETGGLAVLRYYCKLHPQFMQAALLVVPAAV